MRFQLLPHLFFALLCCGSWSFAQQQVDPELVRRIVEETLAQQQAQAPQQTIAPPPSYFQEQPAPFQEASYFQPPEFAPEQEFFPEPEYVVEESSGGGWTFDADFLFLRPRFEGDTNGEVLQSSNMGANTTVLVTDYDHSLSFRYGIGYEGDSGTGIRFQHWMFDDDSSSSRFDPDANATDVLSSSLNMRTFDLELTQRGAIGGWLWMGSAGLRYAKLHQRIEETNRDFFGDEFESHDHNFEGWGPTAGLEVRRVFNDYGLTAVLGGRGSWLTGNVNGADIMFTDFIGGTVDGTFSSEHHANLPVLEFLLGLEHARETRLGTLTASVGVEAHRWVRAASWISGSVDGEDQADLGLSGFKFGLELQR